MTVEIPTIYITDDWTVDDIHTEDDCDDAHALLTALIVSIEARMDDLEIAGEALSIDYKRCKSALRWKKAAMQVVNTKRGKLNRLRQEQYHTDRKSRLCAYFAAMHPVEYERAIRHVEAGTDTLVTKPSRAAQ
ncbi:hypothetical protein [Gemmobacter denitrificans]|uniref:Uncharacterized protein n=1 Tax=Gemmobacter denitrificans TaxID=3123040 RepID=A0ABU8BSJ2_9RHOB